MSRFSKLSKPNSANIVLILSAVISLETDNLKVCVSGFNVINLLSDLFAALKNLGAVGTTTGFFETLTDISLASAGVKFFNSTSIISTPFALVIPIGNIPMIFLLIRRAVLSLTLTSLKVTPSTLY